jgi:predicted CXXCH cytochrome family protein
MDTPEERERMNQEGCARCHTAQGFHRETLEGMPSAAPYENATGLTCNACHFPGEGEASVGGLRAGDARQACLGCHDEIVSNTPDYLSWCSQEGVFNGTGGAEVPGLGYPASAHSAFEKGCVTCHMASAAAGLDAHRVGGHTFWVKTKDEDPVLFNPTSCTPCHGEMTLERLEASQSEVRDLLATLAELLPQKPHPTDHTTTEPRYPADPSQDEVATRSSFNYWLIEKDGSLGVHNPRYTRALLEHSIEELRRRDQRNE